MGRYIVRLCRIKYLSRFDMAYGDIVDTKQLQRAGRGVEGCKMVDQSLRNAVLCF